MLEAGPGGQGQRRKARFGLGDHGGRVIHAEERHRSSLKGLGAGQQAIPEGAAKVHHGAVVLDIAGGQAPGKGEGGFIAGNGSADHVREDGNHGLVKAKAPRRRGGLGVERVPFHVPARAVMNVIFPSVWSVILASP